MGRMFIYIRRRYRTGMPLSAIGTIFYLLPIGRGIDGAIA